jgi:hypothetical protein
MAVRSSASFEPRHLTTGRCHTSLVNACRWLAGARLGRANGSQRDHRPTRQRRLDKHGSLHAGNRARQWRDASGTRASLLGWGNGSPR